ncbi:MAG: sulfatase [Planctomycetes bacterium]|nr:sulfatase [Planctomycetota bacterium]
MNIVLVVFDSLRKDAIGAYGSPPWGKVHTPNFDRFASESLMFQAMYPESLPTLPTRRALYTGRRVYPFHNSNFNLKGDFVGAPGWGPIPEDQPTLAERLKEAGYRTALIADVYHMFKPSKNYWRGFDQWTFLRGQEKDPMRSGPRLTREEVDYWLPKDMQNEKTIEFIQQCIMNIHDRTKEEDFLAPRVLQEAAVWLQQNRDADRFFLTVESFDPHEPWLAPAYYRQMYLKEDGREQVKSGYDDTSMLDSYLLKRTQANYSGAVTMCDRWFGYFLEQLRVMGLTDDTMVVFTTDHGHSIGDRNYMGKRGYPSSPEVYDVPLMIRFPKTEHAGTTSDAFVQHIDVSAEILRLAGADASGLDGRLFLDNALKGKPSSRKHVTVGWGTAVTVITDRWWFNCKVDGTGVLLHDRTAKDPFAANVADDNGNVVEDLWNRAVEDAGGDFPEWLLELARKQMDAPGCSDLAARPVT